MTYKEVATRIVNKIKANFKYGFLYDDRALSVIDYYAALLEWNTKINLISRKNEELVLSESLIEVSSFAEEIINLEQFKEQEEINLIDIGSGGGLPGLLLAMIINNKKINYHLLDSRNKKIIFLNYCINKINLEPQVTTICKRVEYLDLKEKFDIVVSRGVGKFDRYLGDYQKLLANNGIIYLLTGIDNLNFTCESKFEIHKNPYLENRIVIEIFK